MYSGIIKTYFPKKGYGFIIPDQDLGRDVFFHVSGCLVKSQNDIFVGLRVTFELGRPVKLATLPPAVYVRLEPVDTTVLAGGAQ